MHQNELITGILALILAGIHHAAGTLRFLDVVPRSRWLSAAGGVSTAYIFVHILPELAASQRRLGPALDRGGWTSALEHHSFLLALLGLIVFYGLERAASTSRKNVGNPNESDSTGIFWIHLFSFAIYNFIIGLFLLPRAELGRSTLFFFFFAMGLHFVINDSALRHHYPRLYHRYGRWLLGCAVFAGWGVSVVAEIGHVSIIVPFSLVAGGIILNVLKEELPDERESHFWSFAGAALAYAAILLFSNGMGI